jgi:anhydro-N-acetylmuramic acid kinase
MQKVPYPECRVIGLMSGTSLDGMDMVRVRFSDSSGASPDWEILDYEESRWPEDLRVRLEAAAEGQALPAEEFAALHYEVARQFAEFLKAKWPEAIPAELAAFPGQTVHHAPEQSFGLQLGNPSVFSNLTGLTTIGDFRSPDLALGGQGAPLVPLADALLRRDSHEARAIVNIGGISNLTLLPPGEGCEGVKAWDTGPGNLLMDRASRLILNKPFDRDGQVASRGRPHAELLERWLGHPYFKETTPKSTGREVFGRAFLDDSILKTLADTIGVDDLLATLLELLVESLARDLESSCADVVYLAGGGAHNIRLVERLAERLPTLRVENIEALGCPAGAKEALDFALLAYLAHLGLPISLAQVTGASWDAPAGVLSIPIRGA